MEGDIDPFDIEGDFEPSQIPDKQMQQLAAGKFIISELTHAVGYGLMNGAQKAKGEDYTFLYWAIPLSVVVLGAGVGAVVWHSRKGKE